MSCLLPGEQTAIDNCTDVFYILFLDVDNIAVLVWHVLKMLRMLGGGVLRDALEKLRRG